MDLTRLKSFCQKLNSQEYVDKPLEPPTSTYTPHPEPNPEVVLAKIDVANLINFSQLWTDVLEVVEVDEQFKLSEYDDRLLFEKDNYLYNLGFFYVRVNHQCSVLELLGLLEKIPFEQFRMPSTDLVSYSTLSELFGEKMEKPTIQLMVLGDFFKFWTLINPFKKMRNSHENTKLIISAMGSLAVAIIPGYFQSCLQLVNIAEHSLNKQAQSNQKLFV